VARQTGSLLDQIKERIANAGKSRKHIFFVKDGQKRRVRFLTDMENGLKVTFHDKYGEVNTPCLKQYGKACEFCGVEGLRTRDQFAWCIYDYEAKEVRILMHAPNAFSPIPQLIEYYETHGTLLDRDYTISRRGSGTDTSYAVIAGDKGKFRLQAKPFSQKKMWALIWDANGPGSLEDFEEDTGEEEEDEDFEDEEEEGLDEEDSEEEEEDEEEEELPRRRQKVTARRR